MELVVVVILLAVFATVALSRLFDSRGEAGLAKLKAMQGAVLSGATPIKAQAK